MESGRKYNKKQTSKGNGLSSGASNLNNQSVLLHTQSSSTSKNPIFDGESESKHTFSGDMDGSPIVNSPLQNKWGYIAPSGTNIEIDDTPGNETVSVIHHSGAGIKINPDGSIFITSTSRKGIGVSAPYGDAFLNASGEVSIKGSTLSFETSGDANFDIGGNLNINCQAYKMKTKLLDQIVDGYFTQSITNDSSTIIGGILRETIAGDKREQITGNNIFDVGGNNTYRIDGDSVTNITGDNKITSGGDVDFSSLGNMNIISSNKKIHSNGTIDVVCNTYKNSSDNLTMTSDAINITSFGNANFQAIGTARIVSDETSIGGDKVLIKTGDFKTPISTVYSAIDSPSTVGKSSKQQPKEPQQAEIVDAEDIVDSLTSKRKYPEYPENAIYMSADSASYSIISHDSTNQGKEVYKEYASLNHGTYDKPYNETHGVYPEISPLNRQNDIQGIDPNIQVPANHNYSSKISRFFSLGDLIRAKHSHSIPKHLYKKVVANHIYVAYNVLDPIKLKFPDIIITSAYRKNSSNHVTGLAVDIVCESRSLERHAEVAAFARDNLSVDQVFLERNTSGRTHIHLRASYKSVNQPTILTCGDPKCLSKTAGISVEYLRKKGVR